MLDSAVLCKNSNYFSATVWVAAACWPPTRAVAGAGERTSNFSKPVALRGPRIAFGLTFTTPSGVHRPQHAGHNGARSAPPVA